MASSVIRSKIAKKGRLVIPKPLRDKAGLKEGDYVHIEFKGGEIIMIKEPAVAVDAMKGLLASVWPKDETSVRIQRGLRKEWQKKR